MSEICRGIQSIIFRLWKMISGCLKKILRDSFFDVTCVSTKIEDSGHFIFSMRIFVEESNYEKNS